jgi:hypothetical protein
LMQCIGKPTVAGVAGEHDPEARVIGEVLA